MPQLGSIKQSIRRTSYRVGSNMTPSILTLHWIVKRKVSTSHKQHEAQPIEWSEGQSIDRWADVRFTLGRLRMKSRKVTN
jgi:hypothetical protein